MNENVNHPKHYGGDTPYETIKVIEAWGLDFHLGNAVKYISRAGKKGIAREDLEKAVWYLNKKLELMEPAPEPESAFGPGLNAYAQAKGFKDYSEYNSACIDQKVAVGATPPNFAKYTSTVLIPFRGKVTVEYNKDATVASVAVAAKNSWNEANPNNKVDLPLGFRWTLGRRVEGVFGPVKNLVRGELAMDEFRKTPSLRGTNFEFSLERVLT